MKQIKYFPKNNFLLLSIISSTLHFCTSPRIANDSKMGRRKSVRNQESHDQNEVDIEAARLHDIA
jgi:hypothetical protein